VTPALALLVDALAAYRLTRLVTADTITEPARGAIIERAYRADRVTHREGVSLVAEPGGTWSEVALNDPEPPKLAELVTCRWCAGMWVSLGVVAARRLVPRAWRPLADTLALSAAAALLARLED
jgi:hypothetical protein